MPNVEASSLKHCAPTNKIQKREHVFVELLQLEQTKTEKLKKRMQFETENVTKTYAKRKKTSNEHPTEFFFMGDWDVLHGWNTPKNNTEKYVF